MLENEAGAWHPLQSLESGTVILEMGDGAYEPVETENILIVKSSLLL